MKKLLLILLLAGFALVLWPISFPRAEAKPEDLEGVPAGTFPKLPATPNDPILTNAVVYPQWGPICQRYTYSVVYKDEKGRAPEYVRIWFNGHWVDIEKEDSDANDYKTGVKYIYKYVPTKIGSNFYFFEASNGLGKARGGIIDSPDNGPVLFDSAFDKNEVVLINASTGKKAWSYPLGKEWVGGVALSDDGKYLAVQAFAKLYLFETKSAEPKWVYDPMANMSSAVVSAMMGGDVKGGVDICANGSKIFTLIGNKALLFGRDSNEPLWEKEVPAGYNAAISADCRYAAVATVGSESDVNTNLLVLWSAESSTPLWQYHASGNFHDVSLSSNGSFIAAATGCPDRRAYLFSKDSNEPLWRSEMLTKDSPVHQANISADGSVAAYGAESMDGAVHFLSRAKGEILWKFPAPQNRSFRVLSMTQSGKFIGGATFGGDAYIFGKDSKTPLAHWKIATNLGAADVADDGGFIAVGGTDNKVRILERETKKTLSVVSLNEHVGEIDISGNGKFIAAGTGGSVYFFETLNTEGKGVEKCEEIIEPEPMLGFGGAEGGGPDGLMETLLANLHVFFGAVSLMALSALAVYLLQLKGRRRAIIALFSVIASISLLACGAVVFFGLGGEGSAVPSSQDSGGAGSGGSSGDQEPPSGEPVCGNSICEPDKGETKETCAEDCSAGD